LQDLTISPDGRHVAAVASGSSAVLLWNLASRSRTLLNGHSSEEVMCAAFSPDSRILASGAHDQTVRLWDVSDHKSIATLTNEFPVGSIAFSPDGRTLIVGGSSFYFLEGHRGHGGLQFWDVRSQQPTGTILGDASDIVELDLSTNGSLLATGDKGGAVRLWDAQTRQLHHLFESQFGNQVISLAFSPTEPLLAASDLEGNIVLYNTTTMNVLSPPLKAHTWRVMSLAFSPEGTVTGEAFNAVATTQVDGTTTTVTTVFDAVYHFVGSKHSFTVHFDAVQTKVVNGAGTTVSGLVRGVITEGWLKGNVVEGEYTRYACPQQEGSVNGFCFDGIFEIKRGSKAKH